MPPRSDLSTETAASAPTGARGPADLSGQPNPTLSDQPTEGNYSIVATKAAILCYLISHKAAAT